MSREEKMKKKEDSNVETDRKGKVRENNSGMTPKVLKFQQVNG